MVIEKENYYISFTVHRERYNNHCRTVYEDIEINFKGNVIKGDDLSERNYLRILNEIIGD